MSIETTAGSRPSIRLRADLPERRWIDLQPRAAALLSTALIASAFVFLGASTEELGPIDSKLGMAIGARFGPLGMLFGAWEATLWPIPVAIGKAWTWAFSYGLPTQQAVRWPAALAGVAAGLILSRRMLQTFGPRASVLVSLAWFGSVGLMVRSGGAGLDMIAGAALIAALDRLIHKGSDLIAGFWTAFAVLSAGWPPLALVILTTIVLGRNSTRPTLRLILPSIVALAGWSTWALMVAKPEIWAAALTVPFKMPSNWMLIPTVLGLGMPWSPLALLILRKSTRAGWSETTRPVVFGWLQTSIAAAVIGTVIPGFSSVAILPALAGLAMVVTFGCEQIWKAGADLEPRTWDQVRTLTVGVTLTWALVCTLFGGHLSMAVPYYRPIAIASIVVAIAAAIVGIAGAVRDRPTWSILGIAIVALGLKLAHWGYWVPESNYRQGQGPWGRAIGQWVPARRPIYITHKWPTDLAFALGRPVQLILSPHHINFQDGKESAQYLLLLPSEFEHWPRSAGKLIQVHEFQDEFGEPRILARTNAPIDWDIAAEKARQAE